MNSVLEQIAQGWQGCRQIGKSSYIVGPTGSLISSHESEAIKSPTNVSLVIPFLGTDLKGLIQKKSGNL